MWITKADITRIKILIYFLILVGIGYVTHPAIAGALGVVWFITSTDPTD